MDGKVWKRNRMH